VPYVHNDRVPFAGNRVSAENAGPSRDVSSRIRSPALRRPSSPATEERVQRRSSTLASRATQGAIVNPISPGTARFGRADRSTTFEKEVSSERSREIDQYPYSYTKPGHSKEFIPLLSPCDGLENARRYSNKSQRYAEGPCPSSSRKETDPCSKI